MPYTWYADPLYRYRDDETGRFVSRKTVWGYSDTSAETQAALTRDLAQSLAENAIDLPTWQQEMRDRIKGEYIRQYLLGIGGRDAMTQADWGRLGAIIKEQYQYLDGFASEIAEGTLSERMIGARAEMYLLSAREGFERASAASRGIPDLPAFPGDGSSCLGLTRCGCHWDYRKEGNVWKAYWVMNPAKENCELCIDHASEWAPYEVEVNG